MNIQEILKQLDTLFAERRIGEIEAFLQNHLQEAMEVGDFHSAITITNELIGFYRDTSQYEKSVFYCEQVLVFMKKLNLEGSVPYATTLLNVANAYRAAGKLQESFETYQGVFAIYNQTLGRTDFRYASLYNNLSLLYQEMGDFEKSCECLENALQIVSLYEEARIELAVTYTNLAMSQLRCERYQKAIQNLQLALAIFEQDEDKDYHYSAALSAAGEAMYQVEEYDKAASYYEKALAEIEKNVGRTRAYEITKENLEQVYAKQKATKKEETLSGLELSRRFYEEYGKPMLEKRFAAWKEKIAVGLVGEGSECFGFDDDYSKDHDFGPGFCMWLSDETYEQIGKQLQQAYEELPTTYLGVQRIVTPQGKNRVGVFRIGEFYEKLIGIDHAPQTMEEWIVIPEERLATAVNGFVFTDEEGAFSTVRNQIKKYYPEELRIKKIAQEAALMAQSGQYNYRRMLLREDYVATQLALSEYMQHAMKMVYLLNRHFAPFYKWMHRGLQKQLKAGEVFKLVERLAVVNDYRERIEVIEEIAAVILEELRQQGLTKGEDTYMDAHTEQILNTGYGQMELVDRLVQLEWNAFDKVKNEGEEPIAKTTFRPLK